MGAVQIGQFQGDKSYYTNELSERFRVVCLGAPIPDESRRFSAMYLAAAAIGGAGVVILYSRHRKGREAESPEDEYDGAAKRAASRGFQSVRTHHD